MFHSPNHLLFLRYYVYVNVSTVCFSADCNILKSQLLKTVVGGRDALWEDLHTVLCTMELQEARWADSVCVCVCVCECVCMCVCACYNNAQVRPPYTVNPSAQWDQCNKVEGCQMTLDVLKVPFLQMTADLIRDQCIDDPVGGLF